MKYIIGLTMTIIALSCNTAQAKKIQLYDKWQVQSSAIVGKDGSSLMDKAGWLDAKVPSTAMGVLMDNSVFPVDFLESDSYRSLDRSRFDEPWWWRTKFKLKAEDISRKVSLRLEGLNYRADVWVNGKLAASSNTVNGPFISHSIDITPYIRQGENKLAIMVYGPKTDGTSERDTTAADRNMGLIRPAWIDITGDVAIVDAAVKSKFNKHSIDEVWLCVEATLDNKTAKPVSGVLKAKYKGVELSKRLRLRPGKNTVDMIAAEFPELHVKNPALWWPADMGPQNMSVMELSFEANGVATDATAVPFGIRKVETYVSDDNRRGFKINGFPVLLKGAAWTDDIFLRNDSTRNRMEISNVRQMGLNALRMENFPGTSGHLYGLCDSLGIMVLPGWSGVMEWNDTDLASRSLANQVTRLRNHPSVIAWYSYSDGAPSQNFEQMYRKTISKLDERPQIISSGQDQDFFTKTEIAIAADVDGRDISAIEDSIRKEEWQCYDTIRKVFEAKRIKVPNANGVIGYMLNAPRPGAGPWLYDHNLNPTPVFYALKKSNAPVQLIYDRNQNAVMAVNETLSKQTLNAIMTIMRQYPLYGNDARTDTALVAIEPCTAIKVFELDGTEDMQFVFLKLEKDNSFVAENFYVVAPGDDLTVLDRLPGVKPTVTAVKAGDVVTFTLENKSNIVAFFIRMAALDSQGRIIKTAKWSDNFFSIEPGHSRTVECRLETAGNAVDFVLEGWNVPHTGILIKQ